MRDSSATACSAFVRRCFRLAFTILLIGGCAGDGGQANPAEESSTTVVDIDRGVVESELDLDGDDDIPACGEVFQEGVALRIEDWPARCRFRPGATYPTSTYECRDGRTLRGNDMGWAYDEEPFELGQYWDVELERCVGDLPGF